MTDQATKSDLIDLEMEIHWTTDRAILASDDGIREHAVWLPLTKIEVVTRSATNMATVTMPGWLAAERGLI